MRGLPFFAFCALIAAAPLPIASVAPVSWTALGLLLGILVVLACVSILRGQAVAPRVGLPALSFAIVIVWIVVQSTSLLPGWHHPLWEEAGLALRRPLAGSISLDRTALPTVIRLLSYAGVVWLALYHCRDESRALIALNLIAFAGSLYALYGLIEFSSGNHDILWYSKPAYLDSLTSTFVNRNSYATYVGVTLVCTSGLIARVVTKRLPWTHAGLLAIGWLLQSLALFLTNSRGGIVSTLIGLLILITLVVGSRVGSPLQRLGFATLLVIAVGWSFAQNGDYFLDRLQNGSFDRGQVFRITSDLIAQTPVTGTGYGTFPDAFRMQRRDYDLIGDYDKAHNTYLEDALELGIPAASILVITVAMLVFFASRGLRWTNPNQMLCGIGVAASALVGIHALVDFSLQIPAVAITFCAILGIAVAQSKQV